MLIELFEPPMCCTTGICGPSIDPKLVEINNHLQQIQKENPDVKVERYTMNHRPLDFQKYSVLAEIREHSVDVLPLVYVNGQLMSKKLYPTLEQLKSWLADNK